MFLGLILWLFMPAQAQDTNYEIVVTPSDVIIFVGEDKSSQRLTRLISTYAKLHKGMVKHSLTTAVAPSTFDGKVKVYDVDNIKYFKNNKCDYKSKPVACGVKNNHWTIVSTVTMEKLHANLNLSLLDENGEVISSSSVPVWGFVQLLPRYKKTTVTENSMFGKVQREILEQYPPKRKEIPPLINSSHVSDAIMKLFLSIEVENI
jgi:hypothetical protein